MKSLMPLTIGFDDIFTQMDRLASASTYPFYDVVKMPYDEAKEVYVIQIAAAGYSKKDIEITHDKNILTIEGKSNPDVYVKNVEGATAIASTIASRSFKKQFTMSNDFQVSATTENGILTITATREREQPKIKVITVD